MKRVFISVLSEDGSGMPAEQWGLNPSVDAADVIAALKECGSKERAINEWWLSPYPVIEVEVVDEKTGKRTRATW